MIFQQLINNAALLFALSIVYIFIARHCQGNQTTALILKGVLFALATIGAISSPLELWPGVLSDARAPVAMIAGLFGGPISASITVIAGCAYLTWLGGVGVLAGVLSILVPACAGSAYYFWRQRSPKAMKPLYLAGFSLAVHSLLIPIWLTIPASLGWQALMQTLIFGMVILPLTGLLLALLLDRQESKVARDNTLGDSGRRFRSIVENTNAGYFFVDKDGLFQDVNQAWLKMHKFQAAHEIVGRHFSVVQQEVDMASARINFQRILSGDAANFTGELCRKCADDSVGSHTFSAHPVVKDGEIVGIEGFIIDITQRRLAEESQKESRAFLDNLTDIAYMTDDQGNVTWVNSAIEQITGFAIDEVIGKPFLPFFITQDHASLVEVYQRTLNGESLKNKLTFTSGNTCDFTSLPRLNSAGQVIGSFGIARDITGRLRAEMALKDSENRLKTAQRVAKIGNWEYEISTGKIWGSEEAFRIYNIERKSEYLPLDKVENYIFDANKVNQALVDLITKHKNYDIEFQILPNGAKEIITIHSIAELICDSDGNPAKVLGVIQDITDAKAKEIEHSKLLDQLQQAQKMEAVGTLAGGIAHDFNNILGAITGYAELALDEATEGKASPEETKQILAAAARAKKLVRQILAFSRKAQSDMKPVNINQLIGNTVAIIERTIPKMIALELHLDENLSLVNGDSSLIEQIVLNLASNAKDAMAHGGKLIIETQNETLDQDYARRHLGASPGDYVLMTFSDTGVGMDKETQKHIFDPFYTTKDVGSGTGLGLASVYGTVKSHGGYISCYSEPDGGAVFRIYLPALASGQAPREKPKGPAQITSGGSEAILLVDDEPDLTQIGSRSLQSVGYQVMTASSGEEALDIYREKAGLLDLVIMDLGMPGMGGQKALGKILAINPQAKVVIASGYSANGQVKDSLASGAAGYLAKPFGKTELLKTVREALDGS